MAEGFLAIAVENMANAIKKISVQRGHDVTDHTLVCFGGAGGQHACLVADRLGITSIHIHPYAGVLSALGIGLADVRHVEDQAVEAELDEAMVDALGPAWQSLADTAGRAVVDQGVPPEAVDLHRRLSLRYQGSDTALQVDDGSAAAIVAAFESVHRARFGFVSPEKALVVESIQVEAVGRSGSDGLTVRSTGSTGQPPPTPERRSVVFGGTEVDTPFHRREDLTAGSTVDGPAVVLEETATTVIEPGWRASVNDVGDLILDRVTARPDQAGVDTTVDPVQLEIFNNLFMNIAEQMGLVLENTAASVNIKGAPRLQLCRVRSRRRPDRQRSPHAGASRLDERIDQIDRRQNPNMAPGEVYVMNAPYNGGTHLPDITVVKPVFDEIDDEAPTPTGGPAQPIFFVAARGHHADIGGTVPGSAPADSTTVDEEGSAARQRPAGPRRAVPSRRDRASAHHRPPPGPQSGSEHRRPPGSGGGVREGDGGAQAGSSTTTGSTSSTPTWATSRTTPRSRCDG